MLCIFSCKKMTYRSFELGTLRLISENADRSATEPVDSLIDYYEYIVIAETIWESSGNKKVVKFAI